MTGAIFCERRPATIIRSAWRGEGRKTSAPKRATSKRAAAMDIISMAQHARPNPSGQMELLRAQFTALSSCVKMMPSSWSRLPKSSGFVSVTCLPREVLILSSLGHFRTPLRTRTNDANSMGNAAAAGAVLLLVVDRRAAGLVALRIGRGDLNCAGFAIGRNNDAAGESDFAILFVGER